MRSLILSTDPKSRTRKRTVVACGRLAKVAGIECDFSKLEGQYNIFNTKKRDLPSDEQILSIAKNLDGIDRWTFGMLASFGLRPHEIFYLDLDEFKRSPQKLQITGGKTGPRLVWARPKEWGMEFAQQILSDLAGLAPDHKLFVSTAKSNAVKGARISRMFQRRNIPLKPYDLRHAYAVRCIKLGVPDSVAALMMGHSLYVHTKVYWHWIKERDIQSVLDGLDD